MALSTDDQIEFAVHDDGPALQRLFTLPLQARLDALAAIRGISSFDTAGMELLRQIHEKGDGFRVEVDDPRYPAAVERLIKADAWGQIERELLRAWEYQNMALPGIHHPDRIEVTLTLGHPDDPVFLDRTLGYYGMGSTPGTIWLVAWPTDYNESRIGACAVHELAHNIRTPNVDGPFNLAEWVIHEGLAEVFTVEVCGADSTGAWYEDVTGKLGQGDRRLRNRDHISRMEPVRAWRRGCAPAGHGAGRRTAHGWLCGGQEDRREVSCGHRFEGSPGYGAAGR